MVGLLATQSDTFIIGPVTKLLGMIMNGIYIFLSNVFGLENIGVCIILFTFIIYMCMLPLTIRQQRFSKLSSKMNPEVQAIQKKYKGKNDQQSMLAMNEETKAIYEKYGASPTGGCLPLIIQMPIWFALYRVIYNIPAYVSSVKDIYSNLVSGIMSTSGFQAIMEEIGTGKAISPEKFDYTQANTIIDVLYKFSTSDWAALSEKFPNLSSVIAETSDKMSHVNSFLGGINISDSPATNIMSIAILVPILAGLTQWLNVKLMPQPEAPAGQEENPMMNSMKTMNLMMPIMSAVMSFTLPIGLGLYWIAGALFRSVQQVIINKYMDKVDVDELIKKNIDKANAKREKQGLPKISESAKASTRSISTQTVKKIEKTQEDKKAAVKDSTEYYNKSANYKPGSLAAKANMVKQFNERNNK